jgi:CubicO group peptidase (beta-lactamase class C family)
MLKRIKMNINNKITTFGIALFFIAINISCGQSEISEQTKSDKIDELVSLYADYEGFNGSALVAHEGKIIYKKGFGLANMEWEIPNQTDTKFQIASITKQFTALLIMQLVAENKLDLHKPITTYLPNYPKENGNQITIHHLLTHSSGLGDGPNDGKKYNNPKDMVHQFAEVALKFNPGERFSYSNSGYTLLGYIIETITEKSYEEVLKDKIFTPLNMKNSGFYRHRPIIKNMSSGYNKSWGNYFDIDYSDESSAYAAGAIYSTIEDLFLWDHALYTETLLPKKYLDLIFTKHIVADFGGHYGYGWELVEKPIGNTSEMIETIGHSGTISGYCALQTRIPSSNSTIIFLNNTRRAFLNAMTTAITGILNDESYDFPLKPLAKFMSETIEKQGIEKGVLFYKEHKDLNDYYVSEQELIIEGYKLLHAENTKDAAEVFKLSTEIFPNKDNPYDSYAEALMELCKNEEAIKNYKKSLLLNPENDNAKKMLKKLTGKEIDKVSLLITEDTWGKEVFTFPLRFAKDIKYEGFEEAHFPKGWIKEDSPEFWSYAFVWNINRIEELTAKELKKNLQIYFDGLMESVNKEKGKVLSNTIAKISKTEDSNDISKFSGTVKIYDSFVTKKPLLLNVRVEKQNCKQNNKTIILFRFSPKGFKNDIWNILKKVKLRNEFCDL